MKNLLYLIIGIFLGALACYLYMQRTDQSDKNFLGLIPPTEEQISKVDSLEKLLRKNREVSRGLGTRISKLQANRHINDFKAIKGSLLPALQSLDLSLSSSYSFGLDEIIQLCDDIEYINQHLTNEDKLTGIRIHLGKSSKEIDEKPVFYVDAFITPVNSKGNHIFIDSRIDYSDIPDRFLVNNIETVENGTVSLNNSNPCPDVCGQ